MRERFSMYWEPTPETGLVTVNPVKGFDCCVLGGVGVGISFSVQVGEGDEPEYDRFLIDPELAKALAEAMLEKVAILMAKPSGTAQ